MAESHREGAPCTTHDVLVVCDNFLLTLMPMCQKVEHQYEKWLSMRVNLFYDVKMEKFHNEWKELMEKTKQASTYSINLLAIKATNMSVPDVATLSLAAQCINALLAYVSARLDIVRRLQDHSSGTTYNHDLYMGDLLKTKEMRKELSRLTDGLLLKYQSYSMGVMEDKRRNHRSTDSGTNRTNKRQGRISSDILHVLVNIIGGVIVVLSQMYEDSDSTIAFIQFFKRDGRALTVIIWILVLFFGYSAAINGAFPKLLEAWSAIGYLYMVFLFISLHLQKPIPLSPITIEICLGTLLGTFAFLSGAVPKKRAKNEKGGSEDGLS